MKKLDEKMIFEILELAKTVDVKVLEKQFGFSSAQYLAWQGKYLARAPSKDGASKKNSIADFHSYHVALSLDKEQTKAFTRDNSNVTVKGKNGATLVLTTEGMKK